MNAQHIGFPALLVRLLAGLVRVLWERLRKR
jgi:hypothetical protein